MSALESTHTFYVSFKLPEDVSLGYALGSTEEGLLYYLRSTSKVSPEEALSAARETLQRIAAAVEEGSR